MGCLDSGTIFQNCELFGPLVQDLYLSKLLFPPFHCLARILKTQSVYCLLSLTSALQFSPLPADTNKPSSHHYRRCICDHSHLLVLLTQMGSDRRRRGSAHNSGSRFVGPSVPLCFRPNVKQLEEIIQKPMLMSLQLPAISARNTSNRVRTYGPISEWSLSALPAGL